MSTALLKYIIFLTDRQLDAFYSKITHSPQKKKRNKMENEISSTTEGNFYWDRAEKEATLPTLFEEASDGVLTKIEEIQEPGIMSRIDESSYDNVLARSAIQSVLEAEEKKKPRKKVILKERPVIQQSNYVLPPSLAIGVKRPAIDSFGESDPKKILCTNKTPTNKSVNAGCQTEQSSEQSMAEECRPNDVFENWETAERLAGVIVPNEELNDYVDIGKIFFEVEPLVDFLKKKENFKLGELLAVTLALGKRLNFNELNFVRNLFNFDVPTFLTRYISLFQNISSDFSNKSDGLVQLCAKTSGVAVSSGLPKDCGCLNIGLSIDRSQWSKRNGGNNVGKPNSLFYLTPPLVQQCYRLAKKFDFNNVYYTDYINGESTSETSVGERSIIENSLGGLDLIDLPETPKECVGKLLTSYAKLAVIESKLFPARISSI